MHWFGKFVLIPFNLIAAGAFIYLATQDWKGRQTINAAAVRHLLLTQGLPFGNEAGDPEEMPTDPEAEIPFRIDMAGGFRTKTISPKILDIYFQQAPGGQGEKTILAGKAVPNQLAEVRRVRKQITDAVTKAESVAEKVKILGDSLLLQAETLDERAAIQALIARENVEELDKRLMARIAAVLDDPKTKTTDPDAQLKVTGADATDNEKLKNKITRVDADRKTTLNQIERRTRLTHLLVHLSVDADWQKRVMMVVGLRRYVSAIDDQVKRFDEMASEIKLLILTENGQAYSVLNPATGVKEDYFTGFLGQMQALERLARDRTDLSEKQATIRAAWVEQKTAADNFVAQRLTQLKTIEDLLKKLKAEVDELLVKQANIETGLFEVQREVAVTLDEVYQLEAILTARERVLLNLPPLPKP